MKTERGLFVGVMCLAVLGVQAAAGGPFDSQEGLLMSQNPPNVSLPPPAMVGKVSVEEALAGRRSIRDYDDGEISLKDAGQLLWAAQGITDAAHGLRTAPSAGALYPLEIRLLAGRVAGLSPGLYKYDPSTHALVVELREDLRKGLAEAALDQESVRRAPCVLLISGVVERTARKYGSRAERYVLMEAGHSSENVYLQAISLGLGTVSIGAFHDEHVQSVLRLPPGERLLYIMPVGNPAEDDHE